MFRTMATSSVFSHGTSMIRENRAMPINIEKLNIGHRLWLILSKFFIFALFRTLEKLLRAISLVGCMSGFKLDNELSMYNIACCTIPYITSVCDGMKLIESRRVLFQDITRNNKFRVMVFDAKFIFTRWLHCGKK